MDLDESFPVETSNTTIGRRSPTRTSLPAAAPSSKRSQSRATRSSRPSASRSATNAGGDRREVRLQPRAEPLTSEGTKAVDLRELQTADIDGDVDVGDTAIGQGQVLATPLRWPRWLRRSPTGECAARRRLSATPPGNRPRSQSRSPARERRHHDRPHARGRSQGTGNAGALPGVRSPARPGTAELGPDSPSERERPPRRARSSSRSSTPGSPPSRPPTSRVRGRR